MMCQVEYGTTQCAIEYTNKKKNVPVLSKLIGAYRYGVRVLTITNQNRVQRDLEIVTRGGSDGADSFVPGYCEYQTVCHYECNACTQGH